MGGASSYTRCLIVSEKSVSLQGMADCSCHAVHPHHLTIVREICQGKQSCRIDPTSAQFGVKTKRIYLFFPNCNEMFILAFRLPALPSHSSKRGGSYGWPTPAVEGTTQALPMVVVVVLVSISAWVSLANKPLEGQKSQTVLVSRFDNVQSAFKVE